jgi:hypothetical protein
MGSDGRDESLGHGRWWAWSAEVYSFLGFFPTREEDGGVRAGLKGWWSNWAEQSFASRRAAFLWIKSPWHLNNLTALVLVHSIHDIVPRLEINKRYLCAIYIVSPK